MLSSSQWGLPSEPASFVLESGYFPPTRVPDLMAVGSMQGFQSPNVAVDKANEGSRPYRCTKCSTIITHPRSITRHRMRCDGINNIMCIICGQKFHRKDKVKKHMKVRHLVDTDQFN